MWARLRKYKKHFFVLLAIVAVVFYFSLPQVLFQQPYSTVLEDREGKLLGALIAKDGQWRFPETDQVPEKFIEALVLFEDKRFYKHPGIDPLSLSRAAQQNVKAGKIVSGGSTLSMQVIRLSRNKSRTFLEKIIELILAMRLELRYTKSEILALYASHAPFGGNVVGLDAACWRYFGRDKSQISWSDAALLAVLPNNPSLMHPGRNRDQLKAKRDRLLARLLQSGKMDSLTYQLSLAEPVPAQPLPLPRTATHLLGRAAKEGYAEKLVITTVHLSLQERVKQILNQHHQSLVGNQVHNAAALVLDVKTGYVLAYVGNTEAGKEHGEQVDVITSDRSTGSILKPILYAAMLDEGKLLPNTLVPDIPTSINGFAPQNFSKEHDGAVEASKALIRSLNIPAVYELKEYRYEKFYELLKQVGVTTLHQPADHYGLSLILGGAEGSLWDITGAYASMARTLNNYFDVPGKIKYNKKDFHAPRYVIETDTTLEKDMEENTWLSAASLYQTFNVLQEVYRPGEETGWRNFNSSKKVAWKTGTSHGLRDAWAIGVNAEYAVGVWVGNADGEGRPGLTGTESAAPIMFNIFSQLPGDSWFQKPTSELTSISVCTRSGMRATELCEEAGEQEVTAKGLLTPPCSYHKLVHVTSDARYRVHTNCEALGSIRNVSWFVLPPVQEYYYKSKNLSYKTLPPYRKDCENPAMLPSMDLIYPRPEAKIFIPRQLDGTLGSALFEATHRTSASNIYWHLDGNYAGATKATHRLAISITPGKHVLTLMDEQGELLQRSFTVVDSNSK